MSKYTTELRYIIESGYKLNALTSYPIFDENYRSVLNQYILNHFWMREIGFETAGEFDLYLGNTLNEIMPYYNGMFKMAMSEIDPLTNYKYKETLDKSDVGTTNSISNTSGNSKSVESTPADGLVQMNETMCTLLLLRLTTIRLTLSVLQIARPKRIMLSWSAVIMGSV